MKKITLICLTLLTLITTSAFGFSSGDKIRCYDDVSSEISTIKIMDIGDEAAYIKFKSDDYPRFYSSDRVVFHLTKSGAKFVMVSETGEYMEEIFLPFEIKYDGEGYGHYADKGDSRGLDCEIL